MTWEILFKTVAYAFLACLVLLGFDIFCSIVYLVVQAVRKGRGDKADSETEYSLREEAERQT